jgi:hypothetical protein
VLLDEEKLGGAVVLNDMCQPEAHGNRMAEGFEDGNIRLPKWIRAKDP